MQNVFKRMCACVFWSFVFVKDMGSSKNLPKHGKLFLLKDSGDMHTWE